MEWINAEKNSPKKYNDYLICSEDGIIEKALYINDKWYNACGGMVKYWMPLPKPPQEKIDDRLDFWQKKLEED